MPPAPTLAARRQSVFKKLWVFLKSLIPTTDYPGRKLIIFILCIFAVFVTFLVVAAQRPQSGIRISILVVGSALFVALACIAIICVWSYFNRNRAAGAGGSLSSSPTNSLHSILESH